MTSIPYSSYPPDYYQPEYIDSRVENPIVPPTTHRLIARSVTVSTNLRQINKQTSEHLAPNVIRDQGLPDVHITQTVENQREKRLIRDPAGKNIPKLTIPLYTNDQSVPLSALPVTNRDHRYIESNKTPNSHTKQSLPTKTKLQTTSTETVKQQQPVAKVAEDEQTTSGYWKTGTLFNKQGVVAIGPIIYEENPYMGPFGLNQIGAYIFYIGMGVFILLAGMFLIMSGVLYSQSYPDSSRKAGNLVGIGICAFAFYIGIQLLLIGIWSQKYRQEHPKKKIPNKKPRLVYTPFGYYLYPQYFADLNEQVHMQGYGAPIAKEEIKPVQQTKPIEVKPKPSKPQPYTPGPTSEPVEQPQIVPKPELYSIQLVIDDTEQLPADERKIELTKRTVGNKQTVEKSAREIDSSSKTKKQIKPADDKTLVSPSTSGVKQTPIARRRIVVEPYPASTTSQIVIRPREGTYTEIAHVEDLNDMDHWTTTTNKKTSIDKPISNAFYD